VPAPPAAAATAPPLETARPSATQAPLAAPTAAPDEIDTPDEVMQGLSRLADLRDNGAITPEEYEAQKKDLLGRL